MALKPLIITIVDGRGKVKKVLHIERREAVCELYSNFIALARKDIKTPLFSLFS
jgi:hypothetical protein